MADEDKEKAEKLAAAKKRFEQLKKEQQKKGKKGSKKKDKEAADTKKDETAEEDTPAAEEAVDESTKSDEADVQGEEAEATPAEPQQTKQRSESTAHAEVQELYRKQAAKIEELEKENKSLKEAHDTTSSRLTKTEEELEQLRESSSEIAELRIKAKETDRLTKELASVQRQLTQAQQASKGPARRQSGNDKDISEQLASKTSTIESLELDISNLRNQLTALEATLAERNSSITSLEERAQTAESSTEAARQEIDALKVSISFPTDGDSSSDPEALTKRITLLESDLRSATALAERAKSLDSKIETLTKLHKEATTAAQTKDRELADLRSQLQQQKRPRHHRNSHVKDASDFELGDEETETGALQSRIRALEAENFDLRRGVWRDKRAELQPEMTDVDLDSPSGGGGSRGGMPPRQTSTFQDVITSGINAFTGRPARERAESMGLMSDDEGFDEDAFRLAQEEEAKRRIERIREVKRGLDNWKGWRVDIADMRRNGLGPGRDVGPAFEV